LKNGTFDEVDDDGNLLYWEKETDDWSFGGFACGENIAQVNNEGFCTSYYYQEIGGLENDQEYVLSGSVKASYAVSDNGGATALVQFYDVYGNLIETKSCIDYLKDTSDAWNEFSIKLNFPEGCETIRVLLAGINMVGLAEFSNFSLYSMQDYSGETDNLANGLTNMVFNKISPKEGIFKQAKGINLPIILLTVGGSVILLSAVAVSVVILIYRKKTKYKG